MTLLSMDFNKGFATTALPNIFDLKNPLKLPFLKPKQQTEETTKAASKPDSFQKLEEKLGDEDLFSATVKLYRKSGIDFPDAYVKKFDALFLSVKGKLKELDLLDVKEPNLDQILLISKTISKEISTKYPFPEGGVDSMRDVFETGKSDCDTRCNLFVAFIQKLDINMNLYAVDSYKHAFLRWENPDSKGVKNKVFLKDYVNIDFNFENENGVDFVPTSFYVNHERKQAALDGISADSFPKYFYKSRSISCHYAKAIYCAARDTKNTDKKLSILSNTIESFPNSLLLRQERFKLLSSKIINGTKKLSRAQINMVFSDYHQLKSLGDNCLSNNQTMVYFYLLTLGLERRALMKANDCVKQFPQSSSAVSLRAIVYKLTGNKKLAALDRAKAKELAKKEYSQIAKLKQSQAKAIEFHTDLTKLRSALKPSQQDDTLVKQMLKKYPDKPEVHLLIGEAQLYDKREYDQAIKSFEKALKIEPNKTEAMKLMSRCYFAKKDYKQSLFWIDKAIKIKPHHFDFHNFKAMLCFALGKPDTVVVKSLQNARDLGFFDSRKRYALVNFFLMRSKLKEATVELDLLKKRDPVCKGLELWQSKLLVAQSFDEMNKFVAGF